MVNNTKYLGLQVDDQLKWVFCFIVRRNIHLNTDSLFCSATLQGNLSLRRFRLGGLNKKAGDLGYLEAGRFCKRMGMSRSYSGKRANLRHVICLLYCVPIYHH